MPDYIKTPLAVIGIFFVLLIIFIWVSEGVAKIKLKSLEKRIEMLEQKKSV